MLVLTRTPNQSVIIGNDIVVKIIAVNGNQVSIGFAAPEDVRIHRAEVYTAIQEENARAVRSGKKDIAKLRTSSTNT